jgi:hypothetical protein
MSRTVIVEQKSSRSGRVKTTTRSVECELTQSMAKRKGREGTDKAESLFRTEMPCAKPKDGIAAGFLKSVHGHGWRYPS